MAVIVYHHLPTFGWAQRGYEYPLFWGLVMLAVALRGGGPYSLDRAIGRGLLGCNRCRDDGRKGRCGKKRCKSQGARSH
jgi:hypothetical protein